MTRSAAQRRKAVIVAVGLVLALAAPALAPAAEAPSKKQLEEIEREIRDGKAREAELAAKAAALAKEVETLRDQMVKSARAIQERETQMMRIESELDDLKAREAEQSEALERDRAQLAQTLAALERLSLRPPEALIAYPGSADDTIRSALLLRRHVPLFEARAAALREDLAEIAALRGQIARRHEALGRDSADLERERNRLSSLFAQKEALQRATDEETREAVRRNKALAEQAKDLRDLMARVEAERRARAEAEKRARLEAERRARADAEKRAAARRKEAEAAAAAAGPVARLARPEGLRSFAAAQGRITLPAAGRIVRHFAEATETGSPSRGIQIETRHDAQVVAPYDGQVVFAGQFRGYGLILIIEHTGGYHTLLSGLSRIDVAQNQWLLAGEPVGVVGRSEHGTPRMYMEIRLKGRPINPLPWLAADNSKVNG